MSADLAADLAKVLRAAADVIKTDGLCRGEPWPGADDGEAYEPGLPVDVVGALAVSVGYHEAADITRHLTPDNATVERMHPAVAALAGHLGCATAEQVVVWSDTAAEDGEVSRVLDTLRAVADDLDARAVTG